MGGRRRIHGISLTPPDESGLMRPVARIAQSVEQGIENPRVLGSIPSPGTTYSKKPACGLVFCFWGSGLFIERRSIHSSHPCDSPCGQRGALCKNAPGVFVRVRAPLIQRTRPKGGFLLLEIRTLHRMSFDSLVTSLRLAGDNVRGWYDISDSLSRPLSHALLAFLTCKPAFSKASLATALPSPNHGSCLA